MEFPVGRPTVIVFDSNSNFLLSGQNDNLWPQPEPEPEQQQQLLPPHVVPIVDVDSFTFKDIGDFQLGEGILSSEGLEQVLQESSLKALSSKSIILLHYTYDHHHHYHHRICVY